MLIYNYLIYPIEIVYKTLYLTFADWAGNYGIAVIALSLLNFIVLFPFAKKAQEIQQEEAYLQGILRQQIQEIKETFRGTEQFEKIQRLYDRYGYHPIMAIRSILGLLIQLPFLLAAFYMLSNCAEIQGVSWGVIRDLGKPDALLGGVNVLPFLMTFISVFYAFLMPGFNSKQKKQTVLVSVLFLLLLYKAPSALLIFWTCNIFWSLLHCVLATRLRWISDFIAENELAFHIIFALALTVGLLVPLEIYIKNADQLWFGFKDALKYFATDSVKYFVTLLLIYILCWQKKVRGFYLSILLGLLFGIFLQSYIISINYGLFDGHEIEWEKYTKLGLLNTFIWLFCLWKTIVQFKRFKFALEKIKKYVKPVVFGIVAIQCFALLHTAVKHPLPENAYQGKLYVNVLTTDRMYNLSAKKNIIVFLLDAFDASVFEEIIKKDSSELKELKDFTFYPDTTSVFGYTHNSLPQILTGKTYYNDMPFEDYLDAAWDENPFYHKLKKESYDIGIYTDGRYISKNAPVENLISEEIKFNKSSMKSMDNLVLFRMAPHYVKKIFYEYDPNEWTNLLANRNAQVYRENDMNFYLNLKKGLIFKEDRNCFRFYHLTGAHFPYIYNRNMEYVSENVKGTEYDQCLGVLKIVKEYIRQMKERNVFDNSTFVIMADHGVHNAIGSRPLFCIKHPRNRNDVIQVSDNSVSFSKFLSMLTPQIEYEGSNKDVSLLERKYYLQKERDFVEYNIVGNAKSLASWKAGKVLTSWYKKQDNQYVLGTEIDCTDKNRDFEKYQGHGWFIKPDPYGTFSVGPSSDLIFNIKDYQNQNLKFSFTARAWLGNLPNRMVKVYVNDEFASEFVLDNKTIDFAFRIKSKMIQNGKMKLRFDIDHSGIAVKEGFQDLGVLWKKLKIEAAEL